MRWWCSNVGKVPKIPEAKDLGDVGYMLSQDGCHLVYGVDERRLPKLFTLYTEEHERGKGKARKLMERFVKACDDSQVEVYLDASPFEFHGEKDEQNWLESGQVESVWLLEDALKREKLIRFYESFGFEQSDKLACSRIPEVHYYFVRYPKS
jgi:GNAT superfamily N-acetyltransferase